MHYDEKCIGATGLPIMMIQKTFYASVFENYLKKPQVITETSVYIDKLIHISEFEAKYRIKLSVVRVCERS